MISSDKMVKSTQVVSERRYDQKATQSGRQ